MEMAELQPYEGQVETGAFLSIRLQSQDDTTSSRQASTNNGSLYSIITICSSDARTTVITIEAEVLPKPTYAIYTSQL